MVHTISPLQRRDKRFAAVVPLLSATLALFLGGCASVPPPDGAMTQAQAQIQSARDAGAQDYDPVDFGFAQDKFQQAQVAMANGKYALASDLADESRADATLARTKALLGQARGQIQSKTDANRQLRAQNEAAQTENDQHYQQQKAQLSAQMASMQQGDNGQDGDNPASSSTTPAPATSSGLPPQAPIQQDLPAPSASVLNGAPAQPPQGQGFQPMPNSGQQNQGGQ
jgi:PBP1b-binding outer membrane lipoprotein LpoB